MKKPTYIFGHINPDTDTICSAIAYKALKHELGETECDVYRLGKLNKETRFVLNHFGIEEPALLKGVKPQLSDLQYYKPVTVSRDSSLMATWEIMKSFSNSSSTRVVAIVNDKGGLEGLISVGDLTRIFMERAEYVLEQYEVSYKNVLEVTEGKVVHGTLPSDNVTGRFILDCQIFDVSVINKDDVIIITNHININAFADKCSCLIVSELEHVKSPMFKGLDCCVILTEESSFNIINVLYKAISVASVMCSSSIESFTLDNYIEDVIDSTKTSMHRNFPVLDSSDRLVGIISRRHLIDYERKRVILIDHNEMHQSVEGIEHADIVEIIDHHRVANVQTLTPLFIRSEPVGSTATIIFKMYMENFIRPPKEIAGIMLSAVLSDTLMFNSPTCTKEDREAAYKLAKIAGVDLDEYGEMMFKETAAFDEYTEAEILKIDRKEFTFGKRCIYISQVNTINFKSILERQDKFMAEMEAFKDKTRCDIVMLMITDIINNGSEILGVCSGDGVLDKAFGINGDKKSIYLDGVVSRKKQIVPRLIKAVQM